MSSSPRRASKLVRGAPRYNYSSPKGRKLADTVFKDFPHWVRGDPLKIQEKYNIPAGTVRNWYRHWSVDNTWRPYSTKRRGMHRRIFTDEQERELAEHIRENFTRKGLLFTDADFRLLAIDWWYKIHDIDRSSLEAAMIRDFTSSNGFMHRFKKRHRMTSRRVHFKRRPQPNPERKERWMKEVEDLFRTVSRSHILNCDETSWRLYPNGILTWAEIGSENVIAEIAGDEKECITAMATITADGRKLPLYLIAKGKTPRVEESQLGPIGANGADHSPSGWQTAETMQNYIAWLNGVARATLGIPPEQCLHVIMDIYRAHTTQAVLDEALERNIKFHFIPAGYTDQLQPLDRRVFGALKATAKHLYLMRTRGAGFVAKITKPEAVGMLLKAWKTLSKTVIESAWEIYEINEGQFAVEDESERLEAEEEEGEEEEEEEEVEEGIGAAY